MGTRPSVVLGGPRRVSAGSQIVEELCHKAGLRVDCVIMLEAKDILELSARVRARDASWPDAVCRDPEPVWHHVRGRRGWASRGIRSLASQCALCSRAAVPLQRRYLREIDSEVPAPVGGTITQCAALFLEAKL